MIRNKIIFLLAGILLNISFLQAQPFFTHEYYIPGEATESTAHVSTLDGGHLLASAGRDSITHDGTLVLTKTYGNGSVEWIKQYSIYAYFHDIIQTPDSCYTLCFADSVFSSAYNVVKFDQSGNVLSAHRVLLPALFRILGTPRSMVRNNSNYIISCDVYSGFAGGYLWQIFEIDTAGTVVWSGGYSSKLMNSYGDMDTCANGDVVIVSGYSTSSINEVTVTRVALGGSVVWSKRYAAAGLLFFPSSIIVKENDAIIFCGYTIPPSGGALRLIITWCDSAGNINSSVKYTGSAEISPTLMREVENNNIVLFGSVKSFSTFLKIDSVGSILCATQFAGMDLDQFDTTINQQYSFSGQRHFSKHPVLVTSDRCGNGCSTSPVTVVKTGTALIVNSFLGSSPIALTNAAATVQPVIIPMMHAELCMLLGFEEQPPIEIRVSPNPAHDLVSVVCREEIIIAELFDVTGQRVSVEAPGSREFQLNTVGLNPGVYLLHIVFENGTLTRQILVE